MKRYEYKMVTFTLENKLGFDYQRKVQELEDQWNRLGAEGWQFCKDGNGFSVFMREVEEDAGNDSSANV